ncbi:MAG: hypothetical protein AAB822_02210 [Patescibacteria group bacterium]
MPFPEYDIANILQKNFPKKKNFSVSIPLSRQQKFYDLLLINCKNKKVLTIQVKSSRTFLYEGKKTKNENIFDKYEYNGWFLNLDIKSNYSDYYFFYMPYPVHDKNFRPRARWDRKILVFNKKEMVNILSKVKTKSGNKGHSFWFLLNSFDNKIGFSGGSIRFNGLRKHLLENKLKEMKRKISLPFTKKNKEEKNT